MTGPGVWRGGEGWGDATGPGRAPLAVSLYPATPLKIPEVGGWGGGGVSRASDGPVGAQPVPNPLVAPVPSWVAAAGGGRVPPRCEQLRGRKVVPGVGRWHRILGVIPPPKSQCGTPTSTGTLMLHWGSRKRGMKRVLG